MNIGWMTGKTLVNGKGKKQRTVWLNKDLIDLLCRWKENRPEARQRFTTGASQYSMSGVTRLELLHTRSRD